MCFKAEVHQNLMASDTTAKVIICSQDLLEDLNRLEEGLKINIKQLSSFDKYKQEVLLGHLDWSPMHKDPIFWRENITCFEEHDFQVTTSIFIADHVVMISIVRLLSSCCCYSSIV